MSATATQSHRTVTVQLDDPFSSLFQPSYEPGPVKTRKHTNFASQQINTDHKAQTYIRDVEPVFSDPLLKRPSTLSTEYVPKAEYISAKRSARDGWAAVAILGSFIALGTFYFVQRVGGDAEKIDILTTKVGGLEKQIAAEQGVVIARNKEVKVLNEQLQDERRKNASYSKKK